MPAPGETEPPTADGFVLRDSLVLQDEHCQESIDVEVGSTHVDMEFSPLEASPSTP